MRLSQRVRHRIRDHLDSLPAKPTQAALAETAGVTQSWISHYLHGRIDVDLDTLERLCQALQLDLSSLMGADSATRTTLPAQLAEPLALLQALTPAARETVLDLLREMTRPATKQRARRTR